MVHFVVYDGTFEGFLSAVFYVYEYKCPDAGIVKESNYISSVFGHDVHVETDEAKAGRVWQGILKFDLEAGKCLFDSWLSELPDIEKYLLQYIQYLFVAKASVASDFSNAAVLKVAQVTKKIYRERHRMEAFVRFQLTKDNLYYAVIEPDFNVLPLLKNHFKNRYADQRWLIYDAKRRYGIFYNLHTVEEVTIAFDEPLRGHNVQHVLHEEEALYQTLWQHYFKSANIVARKNTKLHILHMPKRYWKYLPEKQPQ